MNYRSFQHDRNVERFDNFAKAIMRSEMAKRDMKYGDLAKLLKKNGSEYTAGGLSLKVTRGKFSFSFFLECVVAMGITNVDFSDYFGDIL